MLLIWLFSVKKCFPSSTIIAHPDSQQSTYFPTSLINREIHSNGQFTLYIWINIFATETQKIWILTKQITNENAQLTKQMTNSTSSLTLCVTCVAAGSLSSIITIITTIIRPQEKCQSSKQWCEKQTNRTFYLTAATRWQKPSSWLSLISGTQLNVRILFYFCQLMIYFMYEWSCRNWSQNTFTQGTAWCKQNQAENFRCL